MLRSQLKWRAAAAAQAAQENGALAMGVMEAASQPELMAAGRMIWLQMAARTEIDQPFSIAVTSAIGGEGRSTIARATALAISSDLDGRVLLVDCDSRPQADGGGPASPAPGFSEYLLGRRPLEEVVRESSNLCLVPAGASPAGFLRLMKPGAAESFVARLKERFPYVVLDIPPLTARAETQALIKAVDGVVLVVRAGVTPAPAIREAVDTIGHAKLLGTVLNGVTSSLPRWLERLL